jgi:hypothetical protein
MANADAPRGWRWVGTEAGFGKPKIQEFPVPASTTIYKNQPVEFNATGDIIAPGAADGFTAATISPGVAVGYVSTGVGETAMLGVILWRGNLFEVQHGGSDLATQAIIDTSISDGDYFIPGAMLTAVTGLRIIAAEITGAVGTAAQGAGTTGTATMQLVDYQRREDNAPGLQVKVIVRAGDNIISLSHSMNPV